MLLVVALPALLGLMAAGIAHCCHQKPELAGALATLAAVGTAVLAYQFKGMALLGPTSAGTLSVLAFVPPFIAVMISGWLVGSLVRRTLEKTAGEHGAPLFSSIALIGLAAVAITAGTEILIAAYLFS